MAGREVQVDGELVVQAAVARVVVIRKEKVRSSWDGVGKCCRVLLYRMTQQPSSACGPTYSA
jgi:hypothetical protein